MAHRERPSSASRRTKIANNGWKMIVLCTRLWELFGIHLGWTIFLACTPLRSNEAPRNVQNMLFNMVLSIFRGSHFGRLTVDCFTKMRSHAVWRSLRVFAERSRAVWCSFCVFAERSHAAWRPFRVSRNASHAAWRSFCGSIWIRSVSCVGSGLVRLDLVCLDPVCLDPMFWILSVWTLPLRRAGLSDSWLLRFWAAQTEVGIGSYRVLSVCTLLGE